MGEFYVCYLSLFFRDSSSVISLPVLISLMPLVTRVEVFQCTRRDADANCTVACEFVILCMLLVDNSLRI